MDRHSHRVAAIIAGRKDVIQPEQRASQPVLAFPGNDAEIALDDLFVLEQSKPIALDYLPNIQWNRGLERRRRWIDAVGQGVSELCISTGQHQAMFACRPA